MNQKIFFLNVPEEPNKILTELKLLPSTLLIFPVNAASYIYSFINDSLVPLFHLFLEILPESKPNLDKKSSKNKKPKSKKNEKKKETDEQKCAELCD